MFSGFEERTTDKTNCHFNWVGDLDEEALQARTKTLDDDDGSFMRDECTLICADQPINIRKINPPVAMVTRVLSAFSFCPHWVTQCTEDCQNCRQKVDAPLVDLNSARKFLWPEVMQNY